MLVKTNREFNVGQFRRMFVRLSGYGGRA